MRKRQAFRQAVSALEYAGLYRFHLRICPAAPVEHRARVVARARAALAQARAARLASGIADRLPTFTPPPSSPSDDARPL